MKKRKLQSVILCSLVLLLILGLSVGVVSLSYAGTRIVAAPSLPAAEMRSPALDVDSSAVRFGLKLDPTVLFERACTQTAYLSWEKTDEEGNTQKISGSGIIISWDGYILTNAHCVSEAKSAGDNMKVELFDGRTFEGVIVGADGETDVALVKIEAKGLEAANLSIDELKGGETIYAMGHPADELKFTMTSGIVSGLNRTVDFGDGTVLDMFQFDAPVNPGNSGGPAFDAYGHVVGMVTAKYVSLTNEGIGFAIPIQFALKIAEDLQTYGYVPNRPLLGITVLNVTAGMIREGSPAGAMVFSAEPGLPGEKAGFIKGDIIVSIDGKAVNSLDDLGRVKKGYRAGDTVLIRFWRDGEYLETYLTFAEVTPEHPTGPVAVEEEEDDGTWSDAPPAVGEDTPEGEGEAEAPAGEEPEEEAAEPTEEAT